MDHTYNVDLLLLSGAESGTIVTVCLCSTSAHLSVSLETNLGMSTYIERFVDGEMYNLKPQKVYNLKPQKGARDCLFHSDALFRLPL